MTKKETVLDFTNHFQTLTKKLIRMDVKLEPSKIADNYSIAVMSIYPEVSKRFDSQKGEINMDDLVEIVLNLESTEKERKERSNKGSNAVEIIQLRKKSARSLKKMKPQIEGKN